MFAPKKWKLCASFVMWAAIVYIYRYEQHAAFLVVTQKKYISAFYMDFKRR
jgi:hypothetical protein